MIENSGIKPEPTDLPNDMILQWERFARLEANWIRSHGLRSGYDRNGGEWNVADVWNHPMGWAQDAGKYCMELYQKCMAPPEEWDENELRELCFKISHCGQIAFSRVLHMRSPVKISEPEDKKEWA